MSCDRDLREGVISEIEEGCHLVLMEGVAIWQRLERGGGGGGGIGRESEGR